MERFVVGTGRCGSTLLSLMLAEHRDVVSLHEFFTGLDWSRRFADGVVTGDELADLIGAEQPVTTAVLARGHTSDEIQYPFGSAKARHTIGDPVPWLSITMLSRLTDDPDEWYDEMKTFARSRPPSTMASHYLAVFEWATARAGGVRWIERSGSSIDYLGDLARVFPEARFVHIHRDGHEAALSIREHPFFRLGVAVFMDLFPDTADPEAAVSEVIDTAPPCWAVGRYWSDQVLRGFSALPALDRSQFLQIRFEEVVTSPASALARIAEFFELDDDPDFLARGSALVRGVPPARFGLLAPDDQNELREACRPGQVLLGRSE
jgi:putative sulfotransferase